MPTTIRLLSTYQNYKPNTIITVADSVANALLAGGIGATTDLTGGEYANDAQTNFALNSGPNTSLPIYEQQPGSVNGWCGNFTLPSNFQRASPSGLNYACAFSAWDEFNSVQLLFMNHQAAAATVSSHIVSSSSTAWPGGVFNINAPEQPWSAPAGAVTIPGLTDNGGYLPGISLGPRIPVRSVPRAPNEPDGGKYPLLFTRVFAAIGNDTMPIGDLGANFPARYDPVNEGYSILTAPRTTGDFTTTNPGGWNTSGARETTPGLAVFGAVFNYDRAVTTIMALGDSIMAGGADGATGRTPFMFKTVARLRNNGKRAAYFNASISSRAVDSITLRGKTLFDLAKADIVVMAPYSTNNNAALSFSLGTQAGWDAQWYQVMEMVRVVQAAGKRVVLTTPLPFSAFSPAQNAFRLKQLQRVVDSGLPFINFESFANSVGTWANQAVDAPDGTHFSQIGHEKAAALAYPVFDALIAK